MHEWLRTDFPALDTFTWTSQTDWRYNCHAWAARDLARWWEPILPNLIPLIAPPGVTIYWPPGLNLGRTITDYEAAFRTEQYVTCTDAQRVVGVEKIALYELGGNTSHTARQLSDGRWTSKLGTEIDIVHDTPQSLEGPKYGHVQALMERPESTPSPPLVGTDFHWDPATTQYVSSP